MGPHYVGGGGQPTYPVSKSYARLKMPQQIPWSEWNPLPQMNDTTILQLFEDFLKSAHIPLSVSICLERAKNRYEMHKKGINEPVHEVIQESKHVY